MTRLPTTLVACAMALASMTGCTSGQPAPGASASSELSAAPAATSAATSAATATGIAEPTAATGGPTMLPTMLPAAGQPLLGSAPVLAVKIDNTSSARPRVGLDSADIVYVEPVEAGLTRLMAIYASAKPAEVGPIRSARESDVTVLANYGRVAFAYSGASTITAATLAGGRQVNVSMDSGGGGFRRDSSRRAPYNVIGGPAALLSRAGGSAPAADIGFHVGPLAPEARPGSGVSTAYPLARLGFSWDVTRGRYLVRVDGTAEVTASGVSVGAATVLVQTVRTHPSANRDVNGIPTPVLEVVGAGAALVLRDGHVISGRWSRSSAAAPTVLTTASGAEMTVAAGPLWVLLVPEGQSVSVS